jgi:hypothetical protein
MDLVPYNHAQQPRAQVSTMTAFRSAAAHQRVTGLGVHAFLRKPFNNHGLLALLVHEPCGGDIFELSFTTLLSGKTGYGYAAKGMS